MRGDSGVAGEGRVVSVPKFHSWGKYTMPLTNINSDWMSNASSGLCIILVILYYTGPLSCILGCNIYAGPLSCILGCNMAHSRICHCQRLSRVAKSAVTNASHFSNQGS